MESIVNQGKLVPDDVIVNILSRHLEKSALESESGFMLDGCPRTTRWLMLDALWMSTSSHYSWCS